MQKTTEVSGRQDPRLFMIRALKARRELLYWRHKMEPDKIAAEIKRLSPTQKLILAQDIWDSIAMESGKLPMLQWQKNELEKRYARYKLGKMESHDWQEVHDELRAKHK